MSDLFSITSNFNLGNFQAVITEAAMFRGDPESKQMADVYMYRLYAAQGNHFMVIEKIGASAPPALQAVRLLSTYLQSPKTSSDVINSLSQLIASGTVDPTVLTIAGIMYQMEGRAEDGLKCVHTNKSLDMAAVHIQILLRMNRLDLALKECAVMQSMSDDATLTMLATAWCNIFRGGEHVEEAYRTLEDLRERYGQTPVLLNGLALCHMSREEFARAEELLQLVLQSNMNDAEALVNLCVCLTHTGRSQDLRNNYMSQLSSSHAGHPWVKGVKAAEESFAVLAAQLSA